MAAPDPWWRGAVLYQIYPRSFADHDGDGVGDIAGIRRHVDHVADLGVDGVWLSPFYRSPMADFGYDISDHCDVDPLFGSLADAEGLIGDLHHRGLRVVVDLVPNHTSDRHRWFEASRTSPEDPKRSWYVWRPGRDGGPPNNWRAVFTGERRWTRDADGQLRPEDAVPPPPGADVSAWTHDPATDEWYLHTFLPQQPDLDWRNPAVVEAMHDVVRFWLERGVDGFRIDALKTVGKPPGLPDVAAAHVLEPEAGLTDTDLVVEVVEGLRAVCDEVADDVLLLGEVHHPSVSEIMRLVGPGRLGSAFEFPPLFDRWSAAAWRHHVDETEAELVRSAGGAWPTWVLSNHDVPRHADRLGDPARARAAAVLLLMLRGTACLFAGEELGLVDADVPPDRRVDPGGRDGCRAPIPWTAGPRHGWDGPAQPWLPFPRHAVGHDAASQATDPDSFLALYRRTLALRRAEPALRHGTFAWVGDGELARPLPPDVLGWRRAAPAEHRGDGEHRSDGEHRGDVVVLVSFAAEATTVGLHGEWKVAVDSRTPSRHGHPFDGHLAGDQAVVLLPR